MCEVQLLCSSILVVIVKTQEAGQSDAAASCLLPLGGGSTPSGNFPVDLNGCSKALKHYMVRPAQDCLSVHDMPFANLQVDLNGCKNAPKYYMIRLAQDFLGASGTDLASVPHPQTRTYDLWHALHVC